MLKKEESMLEGAEKGNILGASDICDHLRMTTADGLGQDGILAFTQQPSTSAPLFLTTEAGI